MNERLSTRGLLLAVITALCSGVGIAMIKSGFADVLVLSRFLLGVFIYGIGIICGMIMIGKYSLSIAYPIVVGLSLVVVAAISATTLGEALTPFKIAGTLLIVVGVAVLVRPSANPSTPI